MRDDENTILLGALAFVSTLAMFLGMVVAEALDHERKRADTMMLALAQTSVCDDNDD